MKSAREISLLTKYSLALLCFGPWLLSCDSDAEGPDASRIEPKVFCPNECQPRLDAGCTNMPENYVETCESLCLSRYENTEACTSALKAVDHCMRQKVTYACTENDTLLASPQGACANETLDCMACTEDMLACAF